MSDNFVTVGDDLALPDYIQVVDENLPATSNAAALALKAPVNNPTFTGTVGGVTKSMVGLGNADNTADSAKPVSTLQQTALDLKAPINNPTFTGTVGGVTKSMVGLGSVDNTADSTKPISTLQQAALDLKISRGTERINVLHYGVVADGNLSTGAGTDNTAAFVTAIAAAAAAKKPLYIPGGSYRTTDMLDLRGVRTYGDGMNITVIMCTDNTKAVVLAGGGAFYLADLTVRHFSLPGTQVAPEGVGVRIQKLQDRSVIERVQVYNVTSGFYSYEPVGDTTNYLFSSAIRDCRVDRFTHSIMYLRGYGAGNTGCVISNIYAQNGNGDGTFGTSTYGYYFGEFGEGIIQQINAEWGFYGSVITIGESSNLTIQAVHFEQVRAKGSSFNAFFNIFGASTYSLRIFGVTIKDCIFDQANISDYAIMRLQSQTRVTFDGLVCTGSTVTGTVTRRKFIFSPADAAASVVAVNWRLPDGNFQSADYYATALASPLVKMANSWGNAVFLYEESGIMKTASDMEITDTAKGLILKSANGTRFKLSVADDGALTTTSL